jgi:P-type Cu2+ transporter
MAETLSVERLVDASSSRDVAAVPRTITLAVPGMHCGGCMRKVEQALIAQPGVISARANLSARRVAVGLAQKPADAEQLIAALEAAGFAASVLTAKSSTADRHRDQDYLKRVGVAGFAAANIMLLSVSVWSGHAGDMPASLQTMFHWLSAAIAVPAIAYAGQPFFASARSALAAGRVNMDVPISLGVTLATAMSLYQTVRGSEQVYFDAAITLLFFLLIGRALDQRMRQRAASAAENLLALRTPATSVIMPDGSLARIPTENVVPGQRILVAAGERIPVDAQLTRGVAEIDESIITGESRPKHVSAGDPIYSGSINLSAPIEAEATAVADNTLLAEIARLIATAEQARGRYVRLADRAAKLYAPAVHGLGAATFAGWLLMGHGWEAALTAAIAVLIVTCPCALALAVPAVQVVATGRLFRHGIVLKSADGLERLAEVDTIVLDKTGTLTLGEPRLVDADALPDGVLVRAAGLASQSRHPYARAVVRAANTRRLQVPLYSDVNEVTGAGLITHIGDVELRLGSADHCGVSGERGAAQSLWFREGSAAPVPLPLSDALRPDAPATIATLSRAGYAIEILSGDQADSVGEIAMETGISNWRAAQRPDDKIRRIEELAAAGHKVLMIGDGLNDAPALAAGHASLSPANAADVSQTAADAVFQGENLAPIIETLAVAKSSRRRVLENFAIAIGYNVLFVPLAMAGLVTPLIAAIAMSASSIAVTVNALRMNRTAAEVRR